VILPKFDVGQMHCIFLAKPKTVPSSTYQHETHSYLFLSDSNPTDTDGKYQGAVCPSEIIHGCGTKGAAADKD